MINRTYIVYPPTDREYIDICVRANTGTRLAPVADPLTFPGATPPPTGWVAACGTGAYYEIRGRTIPFQALAAVGAAGGFTQRTNLGFILSMTPYGQQILAGQGPIVAIQNGVLLSASLLAAVGGDTGGAIPSIILADPTYGVAQPVIRVFSPYEINTEGNLHNCYVLNFSILERKDEDFSPVGSP